MPRKNAAAVALGKRRMAKLSKAQRAALGQKGGQMRLKTMTAEERSEIARKAGLAGGRGRKKTK